ncbi:hypothetical protein IRJ41_022342, partial [Triplophysa rosa]
HPHQRNICVTLSAVNKHGSEVLAGYKQKQTKTLRGSDSPLILHVLCGLKLNVKISIFHRFLMVDQLWEPLLVTPSAAMGQCSYFCAKSALGKKHTRATPTASSKPQCSWISHRSMTAQADLKICDGEWDPLEWILSSKDSPLTLPLSHLAGAVSCPLDAARPSLRMCPEEGFPAVQRGAGERCLHPSYFQEPKNMTS